MRQRHEWAELALEAIGWIILGAFVTTIFGIVAFLLYQVVHQAFNGEWAGAIILALLVIVMALWVWTDRREDEG